MSAGEQIYLSYSRYETEFALKLATDLKNAGVNVWCDRLRMSAGDDLLPTLKQAIQRSNALICVISSNYLNAQYARYEWEHARKKGKTLLPVQVGSIEGFPAPPELGLRRAIDFSGWRDAAQYRSAFERLLRLFGPLPEALQPSAVDQYINALIGRFETRISLCESLDPPDQAGSETARAKLRPISPLDAVWGRIGDVRVIAGSGGVEPGALMPLQQALALSPRFVIGGGTGTGKTTVLERLALDACYAFRAEPDTRPLPLHIDLAYWTDDTPLPDFIRLNWPFGGDLEALVADGQVTCFIDGLNEMPPSPGKIDAVRDWVAGAGQSSRVVVACRTPNYRSQYALELPAFELQPLSDTHVRAILTAQLGKRAEALATQLIPAAGEPVSTGLDGMARSPLHLAGLLFLYRSSPQNALPETVGALYKRLLPSMWVWWRLAQVPLPVPYRELVPSLEKLATAMMAADAASMTLDDAGLALYDPSVLAVRAAASVNVITINGDRFRFAHPQLRDFYAALSLSPLDLTMRLQAPQFAEDGERLQGKWDVALEMMSGFLPASDALVRSVVEIDPFLASFCIGAGAHVSDTTCDIAIDSLLHLIDEPGKQPAVRSAFVGLGLPFAVKQLVHRLASGSEWMRQAALWAVKELHVPLPSTLLRALRDWDWTPSERAADLFLDEPDRDGTLAALINMLDDSDPARRRGAAWALGVLGDRAATGALKNAMEDSNAGVRDMAAKALRQVQARNTPPAETVAPAAAVAVAAAAAPSRPLVGPVARPDSAPAVRKTKATPPPAKSAVKTTPAAVVVAAAAAARNPAPASTTYGELIRQLSSPDWERRQAAVRALGELKSDDAIMPLLESLQDPDEQVRFAAVRALGHYQGQNVLSGLLSALSDDSYLVKDAAGEALANIGQPAVAPLIALLQDPESSVDARGVAIETLGALGDPSATPVLVDCLADPRAPRMEEMRLCDLAAAALEMIGSEAALAAVHEWQGEQQPTENVIPVSPPRDEAETIPTPPARGLALDEDEPQDEIYALLAALRVSDTHAQHQAAKALRDYARSLRGIGDQQALYALSDALRDPDHVVRWASVEALAWLQDDAALPILHEALHDRHFTVRLAAIRALQEINDTHAVWALLERLRDENRLIREKAAEALGRLAGPEAGPRLAEALLDEDVFVRRAAAVSLGSIGAQDAVDALLAAFDEDELIVAWAAAQALGKIGDPAAIPALETWLDNDEKPMWDERRACDVAADALQAIAEHSPEAASALRRWRVSQASARVT